MAYSEKEKKILIDEICGRIENGISLRESLKFNKLPAKTFYEFINDNDDFGKQYVRACEARADKIFEEILDIADDGTNDYMTIVKGDVEYNVENKEVTNRSKLRVDARKWMLSKMQPKKYGDKLEVEQKIQIEQPLFGDDKK